MRAEKRWQFMISNLTALVLEGVDQLTPEERKEVEELYGEIQQLLNEHDLLVCSMVLFSLA